MPTLYKGVCRDVKYFTAHVEQYPLLSGNASKEFGMIERIHTVKSGIDNYPQLRKTTATLPGTYSLKIDPTVPPVVHAPRKQPQALAEKIKAKLDEMENNEHIVKILEPQTGIWA